MKEKKIRMKRNNRKKQLALRIRVLVLALSFTALIGIVYLVSCVNMISSSYSQIVNEDYVDIEYLNFVSQSLYQHQALVLEHLATKSETQKAELEQKATELESGMRDSLRSVSKNMKGHNYESYYHDIYSGIVGYLKNVDIVFALSDQEDTETADYYMESLLEEYIQDVNESMNTLDALTRQDMETARTNLNRNMMVTGAITAILVLVICGGAIMGYLICIRISEEMVNIDSITGIANYEKLLEYGEKLYRKGNLEQYVAVATNIKNFKYINQQIGAEYGDRVLAAYAKFLSDNLMKDELAARQNSDNFLVLVQKNRVEEYCKALENVSVRFSMEEGLKTMVVSSRCGVYEIEKNVRISEALDYAVVAVKEARSASNADIVWFTSQMQDNEIKAKRVVAMFHEGLQNREFAVFYQPKVDLKTRKLCGCEALVRWIRDGKIVPPMEFVPILEDEGLVVDLDFYVFEQVCKDIANWVERDLCPVRISSNFSKLHLQNDDFADRILAIVEKYNVDTRFLEVELTESSGYDDYDAMVDFVSRMRNANIYTAIDDFGTGYSSLTMLKDLDIDVVKLDKSFLRDIEQRDEVNEKMVENIVHMINDLNYSVICEGVETVQQADFLCRINCFTAQGFLFDKPLPHDDFENRLVNPVYNVL